MSKRKPKRTKPRKASPTTSSFRQPSKAGAEKASGKEASKLIEKRIRDLGDWRGETLARMRALILEADPKITEEWKWMCPVWSRDGIVCTGEAYKHVVKLTFARGASLSDPQRLFNSSLGGGTRRAIDIPEGTRSTRPRSRRSSRPRSPGTWSADGPDEAEVEVQAQIRDGGDQVDAYPPRAGLHLTMDKQSPQRGHGEVRRSPTVLPPEGLT